MSRYLVDRIAALSNVVLHVGCEIASVFGNENTGLSGAILHNAAAGKNLELALRHLFLFIGADPNAEWVRCRVARDGSGFILTGADISSDGLGERAHPLETSVPNLFAIGDVRSGSTKRVAAAAAYSETARANETSSARPSSSTSARTCERPDSPMRCAKPYASVLARARACM